MQVFVRNIQGKPLMPCSNRKARLLLKEGKAKIYQYNP
ncbi:RRXRR domain-containing protein, partial [Enterococcus cecorum]